MAAYAEGLGILRAANVGKQAHEVDAETTPLRDPEHYQYDLEPARHRRGVAARQRDRLVAARPDRDRAARRIPRSRSSPAASPIPAKGAGRSRPRSTRPCRRRCSPPRSTSASARAARPISRTSCSRRCASSSAGTSRRPAERMRRQTAMSEPHSDALVFFGATGDLAYKKIFPSLQAMLKRGHLERAGHRRGQGRLEPRPAQGPRARQPREARRPRRRGVREALPACCATSTATTTTRRRSRRSASSSARRSARRTTSRSRRSLFGTVVEQLADVRLHQRRARHRREAVRPRPRLGAAAERDPARAPSTRTTSSASTTTSASGRCTTWSSSASRTRSSSRSGTASTSRACRSRWPRTSACRAAARSTTRPAPSATWSRTTCSRCWRTWRWSRRRGPTASRCATRR